MKSKIAESYDRGKAMDVPGSMRPPKEFSKLVGPGHTGKFQDHAGECQHDKAEDHKQVRDPLAWRKPANIIFIAQCLPVYPFLPDSLE